MNNDFQNDELQVEQYDAAEAESKKKEILKRVGIGVGAAVLLAVLGYFGLVGNKDKNDPDTAPDIGSATEQTAEPTTEPSSTPLTTFYAGGNGAWFNSVVVFLGV